jgi:hypothetical protein
MVGCVGDISVIMQAASDPTSHSEVLLVLDEPTFEQGDAAIENMRLLYFDPLSKQYTDIKKIESGYAYDVIDMTIDLTRNQALLAKRFSLTAIDLSTGSESIISSQSVGVGPSVDPQLIVYDEITDTAIAFQRIITVQKNQRISQTVLYNINLTNGNRTELTTLSYRIFSISLDTIGRRLFAAYYGHSTGVVMYDLDTNTETVLLDTSAQIGQTELFNYPTPDPMAELNIVYSPVRDEVFIVFAQQILALEITTGAVRSVGEDVISTLPNKNAFRNVHIVDDSIRMSVATRLNTSGYIERAASYLHSFDLNTNQLVNLERSRWDKERPLLVSATVMYTTFAMLGIF